MNSDVGILDEQRDGHWVMNSPSYNLRLNVEV